jgi:lipopolysaccharide transport system ATP-binding protein
MPTAIKVENLSKKYTIGHEKRESYSTLRDSLTHSARSFARRLRHPLQPNTEETELEEFWALKGIDFKIQQGDRVGIIGHNGAGKSTLLKILSRITAPTTGKVIINGRVASLLEVGTGFHPELSGRENIYLNGAILGMRKTEIKKKFGEIVDFAEVEKFLDTPVKRYSSGMYVRLAFAVAAHLEPEILIVDEVLAVGDAAFQQKCFGKMNDVSREGRTICLVSHNMQAIKQLCKKVIHIRNGKLVKIGDNNNIISSYIKEIQDYNNLNNLPQDAIRELPKDSIFKLISVKFYQNNNEVFDVVENGRDMEIEVKYEVFKETSGLRVYLDVMDKYDTVLFRTFHDEDNDHIPVVEAGQYTSKAIIPANLLAPTQYIIRIRATIFNVRSLFPGSIKFIFRVDRTGKVNRAYLGDPIRGKLAPFIKWNTTIN